MVFSSPTEIKNLHMFLYYHNHVWIIWFFFIKLFLFCSSLNSTKCATQKRHTKNMVQVYVVTIRYLEQWLNWDPQVIACCIVIDAISFYTWRNGYYTIKYDLKYDMYDSLHLKMFNLSNYTQQYMQQLQYSHLRFGVATMDTVHYI